MGYLFSHPSEIASSAGSGAVGLPSPLVASRLTALEWSVVALARSDRLATIRRPGRIAIAMVGLFGSRHNPKLADPRLEALRRMAVLSWHHGLAVREGEVEAFLTAGFTSGQYELLVASTSGTAARSEVGTA